MGQINYNDRSYQRPPSSANVKIVVAKNGTFNEAYQFDPPQPGVVPPTWTLYPNFRLDVKAYYEQTAPLCSFLSSAGQIVVDDPVQRIIHFNVPETLISPPLVPGKYLYDLIMYDNSVPPIRVPLMYGDFIVSEGVTGG
jgi:hypothetical protein